MTSTAATFEFQCEVLFSVYETNLADAYPVLKPFIEKYNETAIALAWAFDSDLVTLGGVTLEYKELVEEAYLELLEVIGLEASEHFLTYTEFEKALVNAFGDMREPAGNTAGETGEYLALINFIDGDLDDEDSEMYWTVDVVLRVPGERDQEVEHFNIDMVEARMLQVGHVRDYLEVPLSELIPRAELDDRLNSFLSAHRR